MLQELFKLYKIPTEQNLQIQEKKSWGTAAVSLFPKSSTLVLRLSFLQDTILPVFYINGYYLSYIEKLLTMIVLTCFSCL